MVSESKRKVSQYIFVCHSLYWLIEHNYIGNEQGKNLLRETNASFIHLKQCEFELSV